MAIPSLKSVFQRHDPLFGKLEAVHLPYATTSGAQPVRIVHGLRIGTGKKRIVSTLRDNREKIEVRFGDERQVFEKGPGQSYLRLFRENREALGLPNSWKIAEGADCADCVDPSWFTERLCAPLDATKDKLRNAARAVPPGSRGKASSSPPRRFKRDLERRRLKCSSNTAHRVIIGGSEKERNTCKRLT
jgi:hypothetical protein